MTEDLQARVQAGVRAGGRAEVQAEVQAGVQAEKARVQEAVLHLGAAAEAQADGGEGTTGLQKEIKQEVGQE